MQSLKVRFTVLLKSRVADLLQQAAGKKSAACLFSCGVVPIGTLDIVPTLIC